MISRRLAQNVLLPARWHVIQIGPPVRDQLIDSAGDGERIIAKSQIVRAIDQGQASGRAARWA